ncbi:MAG: phosphodiester glycosidase family protein [Planctomycetaceae bacterium]|nr:phosphodiester glycosidase family protein [Planctomycetaceae bacterium]
MNRKPVLKHIIVFVLLSYMAGRTYAADEICHPFKGVTYIHQTRSLPRLLSMHILIINLQEQGISFYVTPPKGSVARETNAQTTSSFLRSCNAQMAVNGDFFDHDPAVEQYVTASVIGFAASKGNIYSGFSHDGWSVEAMNISKDNDVNLIVPLYSGSIYAYSPANVSIYNAIGGVPIMLRNGRKVETNDTIATALHPRTAIGVTNDNKLILIVVDGRQSFSLGMTTPEVADVLLEFGVVDAINLDGGGSSTMVLADPNVRIVNSPSDTEGERKVANHLAVFANVLPSKPSVFLYSNFDNSEEDAFSYLPAYGGSTQGVLSTSTADPVNIGGDGWCEKIVIKDDPSVSTVSEYPEGGWFVRFVSGSSASPSQNVARTTTGYVGFWAKTINAGMKVSLAIDNAGQTERGLRKDLVSDGNWRYYEWNLSDNNEWQGWSNGNGQIVSGEFTIDSIQIFGNNSDGTIYIDNVMHNPNGRIGDELKIPVSVAPQR